MESNVKMVDIIKKKKKRIIGKREEKFVLELIEYLEFSIIGTADSVKKLAQIEKNYKKEYDIYRKSKLDPAQLDTLIKNASPELKNTLLIIFAKSSYIAPKLNKVFDLSLEEKEELSKTMEEFGKFVKAELKKLVKGG